MEELVPIHEGLQYNGSHVTVVAHGLGGMSRSRLALACAERYKKTIQLCSGRWQERGYAAATAYIFREHS
jgi:hypothetical protein